MSRGRKSKEETETRRRQVWELQLRGLPKNIIAKTLGVSPNTITQDVRALRENHRQYVEELDIEGEFGDAMAKFDHLFNMAIAGYSISDRGSDKTAFMSQANMALDKKLKFMMDVGVLPKAAQELKGEFTVDGIDVRRAGIDELKNLRDNLINRMSAYTVKKDESEN